MMSIYFLTEILYYDGFAIYWSNFVSKIWGKCFNFKNKKVDRRGVRIKVDISYIYIKLLSRKIPGAEV